MYFVVNWTGVRIERCTVLIERVWERMSWRQSFSSAGVLRAPAFVSLGFYVSVSEEFKSVWTLLSCVCLLKKGKEFPVFVTNHCWAGAERGDAQSHRWKHTLTSEHTQHYTQRDAPVRITHTKLTDLFLSVFQWWIYLYRLFISWFIHLFHQPYSWHILILQVLD